MTSQHKFFYTFAFIFAFISSFLSAEIINDYDFGFSLDIPEGYEVIDYTDDGSTYHFLHSNTPVHLITKLNKDENIVCSQDALNLNMKKLSANSQIDSFYWNGKEVAISTFDMNLDQNYSGWAVSVPTSQKNFFLTLLCYAPSKNKEIYQQFIISTLNSLSIDDFYYCSPGIITSYAFPKEGSKEITLNIAGKNIKTLLDKSDEEASQFVVDLEYSVLSLYSKHESWQEAWKRYYRMIYRDSYARLENVCNDIYDALFENAKKQNKENPQIVYAQYILNWVQNFNYKRADDPKKADFTSLPNMLTGTGNDCDSRSMLVCTILKSIGIECLLLISPEYSHAMAAAGIEAPGQQYYLEEADLNFIMGETTAKVTWGTIAQDQSDRTKWFHVILP